MTVAFHSPPMDLQKKAEWDLLNKTARIAASIRQTLSAIDLPIPKQSNPLNADTLIPPFVPNTPRDILKPLSSLQVPENIQQAVIKRMHRFIEDLHRLYDTTYRRICLQTIQGTNSTENVDAIHRTFQILYQKQCIPLINSQVASILAEVDKLEYNTKGHKPSFNNLFTPVLEKYFEFNGFPSCLHRSILAQKSQMSTRQIEVWFQNHRTRSRQDGKIVRRLDSDIPLKRALSLLSEHPQQSHQLGKPAPFEDSVNDDANGGNSDIRPGCPPLHFSRIHPLKLASVLDESDEPGDDNKIRPPHAFPARRSSEYPDPFPNDDGTYKFPPPTWRRKPATTPIIPIAVDMDDFAREFHMKLNFVSNPWNREGTPSKPDHPPFTPWFAPLRIIPPSAPLPALQRPRALATALLSSTISTDPFTFVFPKPEGSKQSPKSNITCIIRLPVGPQQSSSSITERIDRSVEALDRKGFRMRKRALRSPRLSVAPTSPDGLTGRKGQSNGRRMPSNAQPFGSRTASFASDTSSDDSSSPRTPPPLPNQSLLSDAIVDSVDFPEDFNNFFDYGTSPSFDFTFSKLPSHFQPLSPCRSPEATTTQLFDMIFTNPGADSAPISSSPTFNFTFPKLISNMQPGALVQSHTTPIST